MNSVRVGRNSRIPRTNMIPPINVPTATMAVCKKNPRTLGSFNGTRGGSGLALCCFLAICLFLTTSAFAEVFSNEDCLDCHTDPTTVRKINGKEIPLLFPTNTFPKSVHGKLNCIDCHVGVKELQHESKLPPPNCVSCHEKNPKHQTA